MSNQLYIEVIPKDSAPHCFFINENAIVIGRNHKRSSISVDDPRVSRVHLQVTLDQRGQVLLMDLNTHNGTFLNGTRLTPDTPLVWSVGEVVTIGDTRLVLRSGEIPLSTAAPPIVGSKPSSTPQEDAIGGQTSMPRSTPRRSSRFTRLLNTLGMVLVAALSLLLLAYVGFGEANRTYPKFELDKLAAQGEVVKNSMESTLLAGLPLAQFPGFSPLTQPLLNSDPSIVTIYVTDPAGQTVFANSRSNISSADSFTLSNLQDSDKFYTVTESVAYYRVSLELSSKFEVVGNLHLILPKAIIAEKIAGSFVYVALAAGVILLIFGFYVQFDNTLAFRRGTSEGRWLNISYSMAFLLMAVVVILTLINIYSDGIRAKTQALANSLGQRLNTPLQLGIDIAEFADLDRVFTDYQKLNPDLSFITLTTDNSVAIGTDASLIGSTWKSPPNHFEYTFKLNRAGVFSSTSTELHVGVPTSVIYSQLWRSVKNFFVLFIAAGFLCLLFFNLMRNFINKVEIDQGTTEEALVEQRNFQLSLIRPFYFLAVFAEALTASFLPQYFKGLAVEAGVDTSLVSTLFTVYFASLVLTLIPAGQYAERRGVKPMLIGGPLLIMIALLLVTLVPNFYAMFIFRVISGIGGGMLLIGVQSYILDMAVERQKTQGAAIIVFGYNGGMISGTAIGALLAVYMDKPAVFIVGAVSALVALVYAVSLIPKTDGQTAAVSRQDQPGFMQNLRNAIKDLEFMKTMLFIGIPAKAVLTGVTIFALPLLLARLNYAQEDIGQIIMLYGAGVLLSSAYVSRLVDRLGRTTGILFIGTLGSGFGLVMIGLAGLDTVTPDLRTILLIAGMTALGLSHGFINAPILTHISETSAASALGKSSATSLYRLLERIGHLSGPIVVGQLLLISGDSLLALSWLGVATIAFGILFLIRFTRGLQPPPDAQLSPSAR